MHVDGGGTPPDGTLAGEILHRPQRRARQQPVGHERGAEGHRNGLLACSKIASVSCSKLASSSAGCGYHPARRSFHRAYLLLVKTPPDRHTNRHFLPFHSCGGISTLLRSFRFLVT